MMSQPARTLMMPTHSACWAEGKGLLRSTSPVGMTYTHLFCVILLVPLMRPDGDGGPCPVPCHCTLEIVNCSRNTRSPRLHQVPLPKPAVHRYPFEYLDFTGNAISSMGKEVWQSYPWAEYLVLKGNRLSRLQNSSLEGLLSLTYLDLSCNKIQIIERNAFEAVPFLQIINLSGNVIEQIVQETFRAWHGMQFLHKVDLSHNPLAVIQDSYFYRLPALKLLDLGATEITPLILEDLLQTSLQLRTLILPKKMSCCLCLIEDDIEILVETVKLKCTESCAVKATLCGNEESLNRLQEELMKALETRKLNGSSLLSIVPERAESSNRMLAQNDSSFAADFNQLKSVKQLMEQEAESLDMDWTDRGEVKKLYLLATLLQAALKQKIMELDKDSPEAALQHELSSQVLEEASKESTDVSLRKEVRRETRLRTSHRSKAIRVRLGRDGHESSKVTMPTAAQASAFEFQKAESEKKLAEGIDPWRSLSRLRSLQEALQSSWKRSVLYSPASALKLRASIKVASNENNLTSLSSNKNSVVVLRNGLGAQTEEELLNWLLHRSKFPVGDATAEIPAIDSEPPLSEISPDLTLPLGTYWDHQRTSVSPMLDFPSAQDDYLLQEDLFEAKLNKKLTSLIPNEPVRKLISHVIRILQMDCTEPTVEMACTKLISRTGLLMKHFSEREDINKTSTLYFLPSKNVASATTASSRKMKQPLDITASQETSEYMYEKNLQLAILVTGIIMFIIAVICLVEICSWRWAAKDGTCLGRRKEPLPDEERTMSLLMDTPVWLKDIHQPRNEMQKKNMVDKLHDEESLEDIFSWGNARRSFQEPPVKKISSRTLSIPTFEPQAAPVPPPTPSQKSSVKQISDKARRTSDAASSKGTSSAAAKDEEDEGGSAEQFAEAASEAASEAAESGEGEGEEEEEEDNEEEDE